MMNACAPVRHARQLVSMMAYHEELPMSAALGLLVVILGEGVEVKHGYYVTYTSNTELAALTGSDDRTVRRHLSTLSGLALPNLTITSDAYGQKVELDVIRYIDALHIPRTVGGAIGGSSPVMTPLIADTPTPDSRGGDRGVILAHARPRGVANRSAVSVPVPPLGGTGTERKEQPADAREADSDLKPWVKAQVRAGGWMAPSDFQLLDLEAHLTAALPTDEARQAFVTARLADLHDLKARGQAVGNTEMLDHLRDDCYDWTARQARLARDLAMAAQNTLSPTQTQEDINRRDRTIAHRFDHIDDTEGTEGVMKSLLALLREAYPQAVTPDARQASMFLADHGFTPWQQCMAVQERLVTWMKRDCLPRDVSAALDWLTQDRDMETMKRGKRSRPTALRIIRFVDPKHDTTVADPVQLAESRKAAAKAFADAGIILDDYSSKGCVAEVAV